MRVACWIRRSDHPSRPRAKTSYFLSSFKTLAISPEATSLRGSDTGKDWQDVIRILAGWRARIWVARRIDPELLLRILLIGYLYCIASERWEATGSSAVFAMLGSGKAA